MAMIFDTDVTVSSGKSLQANKLMAPTTDGGTTYGAGSSGNLLKSNGTNIFWGADKTEYISKFEKASATSHSITIPNSSEHYIIATTNNSTIYYIGILVVASNGNVSKVDISRGSGATVSTSANTLTIAIGSTARKLNVVDFALNGDNAS